jgi:hypothetical protein
MFRHEKCLPWTDCIQDRKVNNINLTRSDYPRTPQPFFQSVCAAAPIIPYPTGRLVWGALSQALGARLRSCSPSGAIAGSSHTAICACTAQISYQNAQNDPEPPCKGGRFEIAGDINIISFNAMSGGQSSLAPFQVAFPRALIPGPEGRLKAWAIGLRPLRGLDAGFSRCLLASRHK